MGTVHGSIPFYYDEVSDDTLNDDVMEILKQKWVEFAVGDRSNKEDGSFWTELAR